MVTSDPAQRRQVRAEVLLGIVKNRGQVQLNDAGRQELIAMGFRTDAEVWQTVNDLAADGRVHREPGTRTLLPGPAQLAVAAAS
ncbi:MAG: hypothetical protein FD125_3043 [bacterium]|nr:MAG: hypothetical protein FD125_3043 [bacterium]